MTDIDIETIRLEWDGVRGTVPLQKFAMKYIPALLSALEAEKKRADEAEALADRLKREAVQHAQEARTANATMAEIYREVSGGKGEPGNWNGAEPVRAELTALRARVAELDGALRRHTVRILTIPGETGDAIRGWSCSECNPGWFDSEDTIAHRDNCIFAALKGAPHEQG